MTTWENIKEEVERTKSEFTHAAKGTEDRLVRGKEFIKALNVAIEAIERFWTGTALIRDADTLRQDGEFRTRLREYQEWARGQKHEVRKEVGPLLIDSWLADESGYDEAAWPAVQQALNGDRATEKGRSSE